VGERDELYALALEEFILELNPVQSKIVQEALHDIHKHQDEETHRGEDEETDCHHDD
jgi:hypothetical protein